jgi:hypothetical protein
MSTLIMAVGVFEDRLHGPESLEILTTKSNEALEFLQTYFVDSMKKAGLDVSGLVEILKAAPSL